MDWSSITRYRGEFAILLGFVLLLNPLAVVAPDLGDPDWYRYEASEVEFYANGTYRYEVPAVPLDSDVACFAKRPGRTCGLEMAIYQNGAVTVNESAALFLEREYAYVHLWGEGFLRPTVSDGGNGTARFGLEPAPRAEAIERISTPFERASPGVRDAITEGSYETSDELPGAHELVRADGRYYVVYDRASHVDHTSERAGWAVVFRWLLGLVGAGLVLAGQRQRVERR